MLKNQLILLNCILLFLLFKIPIAWAEPQNVIFLIGDGMGFEQVKAAGIYNNGIEGSLFFESFPYLAEVTTYSANSSITDSAAAATAIATATKVNNGVISLQIPGDSSELYTLLEHFRDNGKSTGLVSTAYITHATPAAFAAHEVDRDNINEIAQDYLQQTRPYLLFGGGANGMTVPDAIAAGYTVVINYVEMQGLDTETATMVSGQFGTYHLPYEYDYFTGINLGYDTLPHLSEMTATALAILDNDPDGFFLMIEGARIDHAGHINAIERNIFETIEFNNTVQTVYDWARGRSDTLILVTADHETGGLTVLQNNGQGVFPTVSWSTTAHTNANVPIYARGENAYLVSGVMDNTDLFGVATSTSVDSVDYYCDDDRDGFIASSVSGTCSGIGCEPIGCQTIAGTDCDDNAPNVYPGGPTVRINGTPPAYYYVFQEAYANAVANDIIQSQGVAFTEDLNINRNISVIIRAGYDCGYATITGKTIINGNLIISDGLLVIQRGTLQLN